MPNWMLRSALLLLLSVMLAGCVGRSGSLRPDWLPATPELPASARQGPPRPACSPTCTQKLTELRASMQQKLTEPVSPD